MIKKSLYGFYYFGTSMRYLQDCVGGDRRVKGKGLILDNVNRFINRIDELGLTVTKRTIYELINFRDSLEKDKKEEDRLNEEEAKELSDIMNKIRGTLDAEIQGLEAYIVTPKRIDIDKLISNVKSLFAPNIFMVLPEITRYDFNEAGKCIGFERSTAAAFHILRGTEGMIRLFYCSLIKRGRVPVLMWGDMINDLKNKKKTRMHEQLYVNLDNIRLNYRNPTQHPEKIYDIQEVQDLWPLCVEVCSRMIKILKLA